MHGRRSPERFIRLRHLSDFVVNSNGGGDRVNSHDVKRIGHILPFPSVGGTEHATLRIAKAVDHDRFTSIAFCLPEAAPVHEFVNDCGIPCTTYDPPVPSYRHGAAYLYSSVRLARELLRRQVDIVHCSDLLAAHEVALAGRLAGLPVLCHIRNRFEDISRRDRSFLWPVHKFVFVSRNTWRHFAYSVPPERGTVIYDGIDVPAGGDETADYASVRREFGIPEHAPIVGMMARVAPQKDFATLTRAAVQILKAQPDARFLIAGDYASEKNHKHYRRVQADMQACGVTGSFIFTGYRQDVPRLLNALDVFVLSTHCEGLPLVILEAMARGKPVVATAVDGIPEIVHDTESGLLFPHEDHATLASHIARLLKDRAWSRRLGEAGRLLVRNAFSSTQFAAGMNAVYESMLRPVASTVPAHRESA
jgi:glycosyltransferase involved in cell wall biosynthesis